EGENCERKNCFSEIGCSDNGICRSNGTCDCSLGYEGDFCEEISSCVFVPCKNDGSCAVKMGSILRCQCVAGYLGPFCEEPFGCRAEEESCLNDGKCVSENITNVICSCS